MLYATPAIADVLFGDYNPAGRLVQTWPRQMEDLPSMLDYDIRNGRTYMYARAEPLYPFGFGLSYTTFEYTNLSTDRDTLEEAAQHIRIEYDRAKPVFELDEASEVYTSLEITKGEVREDLEDVEVVERTFRVGLQEQLYIENNGAIAIANPGEGVTVWGSMQCPYYVHKALVKLFDLPENKIRIIQAETGGGFGGKEEYPSLVAGHAALLAWKSGKPVKIVYDRAEDMVATTKRHPSRTRHKTAVTKDGKLLAMEIDFAIDGGAYCTLSPVVLSRGTIHAAAVSASKLRRGLNPCSRENV